MAICGGLRQHLVISKAMEKRIIFEGAGSTDGVEQPGRSGSRQKIFLLSPANMSGPRAQLLFRPSAQFDLAVRLRERGVALAEIFSFISPLYFRGKFLYAQRFAPSIPGVAGIYIITPAGGLMAPGALLGLEQLKAVTSGAVDEKHASYREPLDRDAAQLFLRLDRNVDIAILGSIATPKYVEPLLQIFGARLVFPREFVGRGDMSRGGLLLRCAEASTALNFVPVVGAAHHGMRPPKLSKRSRK